MHTETTTQTQNADDEPDQMPASMNAFEAAVAAINREPSDKVRAALAANEEEARRQSRERQRREIVEAQRRIDNRVAELKEVIGRRYAHCTIDSFRTSTPEQRIAVTDIMRYADDIGDNVANGVNIILSGTSGTGKTHLLAALAILAARGGWSVAWRSGPALWDELIAAMKADGEQSVIDELVNADVFILDDPLGVADTLSDYRREKLFRILDQRNRDMRPTWVSINIANRDTLESAMGKATVDRLRGGALRLCFTWDSYRMKGDS